MTGPENQQDGADATDQGGSRHLSLREAMLAWCDPVLIVEVQDRESELTSYQHDCLNLAFLGDRSALRSSGRDDWMGGSDHGPIRYVWARLLHDLRRRIETGELFVEGVQLTPVLATAPQSPSLIILLDCIVS